MKEKESRVVNTIGGVEECEKQVTFFFFFFIICLFIYKFCWQKLYNFGWILLTVACGVVGLDLIWILALKILGIINII